jgi:ring-1,2-phenylacetyl-CoA epoxidase subunit PaaE
MGPRDTSRPTMGLPVASPANMLPVQVVRREVIAPDVVSVFIVLPGTRQAPAPYLAGQFVTLALPTSRETLYRSYSLCGDGDPDHPWELTIKRMEMGAVSTYFYSSVREGTLLYSSLPRGTFTLPAHVDPEMVFVFIAAGSGITPIMGMVRALARMPDGEQPLAQLHYASKSPQDIIFGDELSEIDPDQTWLYQKHYLSSNHERMTVDAILARAGAMGKRAHWYVCGPDALKHELQEKLARLGVPESRVHAEIFATQGGPAYRVEARGGAGVGGSLRIADTGAVLDVQPQETLLTALERHGYRPDFSCRAGACGACKLQVVEGQVDPVGEALSGPERAAGYVLSCIARPVGDVTLASGGRPPAGVARVAAAGLGAPINVRGRAVSRVRMAALVGASALLFTSWNLTDHRPASWALAAGQPPATVTQVSVTPNPAATATAHQGGGGAPTPTRAPSQPTPTRAPGQPTPTATPKPKPTPTPTCVSTPSKPC